MKKMILFLIALLLPCFVAAGSGSNNLRIAVLPFDNLSEANAQQKRTTLVSNKENIDRYSLVLRDVVQTWFSKQESVDVMNREALDRLLVEIGFTQSGLVDKPIDYGKFKNCSHLVRGAILSVSEEEKTTKAYGVTVTSKVNKLVFNLKIDSVEDGKAVFLENYTVLVPRITTDSQKVKKSDIFADFAEHVDPRLSDDKRLCKLLSEANVESDTAIEMEKVEVAIEPIPGNCDVEIGEDVVGTTPIKLQLMKGEKVVIRISKQGYHPWEKRVLVSDGLKLSPELKEATTALSKDVSR